MLFNFLVIIILLVDHVLLVALPTYHTTFYDKEYSHLIIFIFPFGEFEIPTYLGAIL